MARRKRPTIRLAARGTRALTCAVAVILGGCDDGVRVEKDRCAGQIGDPSIATSCVIVQGQVLDPGGAPVSSVNVGVDCFGPERGCGATPGETNGDGTYRLMVHNWEQAGGPGLVVVRAHDRVSDRRAVSDTAEVVFAAMGDLAPVYVIDLRLLEASSQ